MTIFYWALYNFFFSRKKWYLIKIQNAKLIIKKEHQINDFKREYEQESIHFLENMIFFTSFVLGLWSEKEI